MYFDNYSCDNQMSMFDFTREPISIAVLYLRGCCYEYSRSERKTDADC